MSLQLPLIIIILLLAAFMPTSGYRYHTETLIKRRQTHCIYHLLEEKTIATFEVFITDSENEGELSALVQIEGPIAPSDINPDSSEMQTNRNNGMGSQLQKKLEQWPAFLAGHRHNFQAIGMIHYAFHVDFTDAGVIDGFIEAPRGIDQEEKKRQKIQAELQRREAGEEVYEESNKVERITPESFEPFEWTKSIKTGGWYRMCVQAEDSSIFVEADIRSSAKDKLGEVDIKTGHVLTHERKEELDEAARILGSTKSEEDRLAEEELLQEIAEQVKDYDLQATQKMMSEMNSLVVQLQTRLGAMMKRAKGHEVQARRNYKRIVRSGMVETVLYLMITGFQVYTIHSWLLRNSLLGR